MEQPEQDKLFKEPGKEETVEKVETEPEAPKEKIEPTEDVTAEETVIRPTIQVPEGFSSAEEYLRATEEAFDRAEQMRGLEEQARKEQAQAEYEKRQEQLKEEDKKWIRDLQRIQQEQGPEAALLEMNRHAAEKATRQMLEIQQQQQQFNMEQGQLYEQIMADEKAKPLHPYMPAIAQTCIQNGWALQEYLNANAPFFRQLMTGGGKAPDNVHDINDARKKRLMDLDAPDKSTPEQKKTEDEKFEDKLDDLVNAMFSA
jgi:hypothetical protein